MDNYKEYVDIQLGPMGSAFGTKIPMCVSARSRYCGETFQHVDRNKTILDAGCGDGVNLLWLYSNGFNNVIGCDLDRSKIDMATSLTGYPTRYADMHELDVAFPTETFDIILASHCLEHCLYPKRVLNHFYNLLNDDGKLFIVLPYPEDYDPNNPSHVANVELGMDQRDSGEMVTKFFTRDGLFELEHKNILFNGNNEIWLNFRRV
jgi:SAM-dependent methyltransferase